MKRPALFSALVIYCTVLAFFSQCQGPDDAKESGFPIVLSNHDLSVKYSGTASCAVCHIDKYNSWLETGKGRAFHAPDVSDQIENFSQVQVYDPYLDLYYTAFWRSTSMYQAEYRLKGNDTVHYLSYPVHFVIGSGNKTRTYIYRENDYYFEMPITWYVEKQIWDLSPGYENGNNTRFDRPIGDKCMNCHVSDIDFVPHSINRFNKVGNGIGCEKCHGPGDLHIRMMRDELPPNEDKGICNPKNLPVQLQFDVCRQCHLEGTTVYSRDRNFFDFRPGQPLSAYLNVFLPVSGNTEDYGFASHAERLQMSRCFKESGEKLVCNTCHDPHRKLGNLLQSFNDKCLGCHQLEQCGAEHGLMAAVGNDCVKCHMPKSGTTDIPHVSTSDHFIRKRTDAGAEEGNAHPNDLVFKNFTSEKTASSDLASAYMDYYENHERSKAHLEKVANMIRSLETFQKLKYHYLNGTYDQALMESLAPRFSTDPMDLFYAAEINRKAGKPALHWYMEAVEMAPQNIEIMIRAANAYVDAGRIEEAGTLYRTVLDLKKGEWNALAGLGFIALQEGDLKKAGFFLDEALHYNPNHYLALENKVDLYMRSDDREKALLTLKKLQGMYPAAKKYREMTQRIENL